MDKPKIRLRAEVLYALQNEKDWNDTKLASKMGVSRSRLWRARLPETHPEHCSIGESFIVGAMTLFPESRFEDLFFLA